MTTWNIETYTSRQIEALSLDDLESLPSTFKYILTDGEKGWLEFIGDRNSIGELMNSEAVEDDDGIITVEIDHWDVQKALYKDGVDRPPCLSEDTQLARLIWYIGPAKDPENLDQLLEYMQEDLMPMTWDKLPLFDGDDPNLKMNVWSWDATRLIVGTCPDDVQITHRPIKIECACCSNTLINDEDDGELYWAGNQRGLITLDPSPSSFVTWAGQLGICLDCAKTCVVCNAEIIDSAEVDLYQGGSCLHNDDYEGKRPLCLDCYAEEIRERDWAQSMSQLLEWLDAFLWEAHCEERTQAEQIIAEPEDWAKINTEFERLGFKRRAAWKPALLPGTRWESKTQYVIAEMGPTLEDRNV